MTRAALLSMAICLALLLPGSTVHAARPLPNGLPLTPEQRRELEQRNAYCRLALGVLGGVLALGAIGQLVYSIRNFRRFAAEERANREDEPMDELAEAFDSPLDDFETSTDWEPEADPPPSPTPPAPRHPAPSGIIANRVNRFDS
jgi:hypothetical protein